MLTLPLLNKNRSFRTICLTISFEKINLSDMRTRSVDQVFLKARMKELGLKRQDVAIAADCSVNTVSNWLRRDYAWGLEEVRARKVAALLRVNVNKLFPPVAAGGKRAS